MTKATSPPKNDDSAEPGDERAQELYRVLSQRLRQSAQGNHLIAAFEKDPEQGSAALAAYLRQRLPEDNALAEQIAGALGGDGTGQFATIVTGGQVDQIVNIARLGYLNLTVKKQFFIFRDVKQVVAFLLILTVISAGVVYAIWRSAQPKRMDGDFNIAVAQFGQVTDEGIKASVKATRISNALFNFLDSELSATDFHLDIQVSQDKMPIIMEDLEAEQLSQRTNADIVIYGNVYIDGDTAEFSPRFYIADQSETSELTGQSQLAHPIPFEASALGFQDEINVALRGRAAILVHFTKGLVYLSGEDFDTAVASFEQAISEADKVDPFEGQEVLLLFASHANNRSKNFEQAISYADRALTLNPEYARAYLARGNIFYTQALPTWDSAKLADAQAEYELAAKAGDQPAGAYIQEKARVSLGNIYVIQAQGSNDPQLYAEAIGYYDQVVTQYEKTKNASLREMAAVAYFGLGAAYERQEDHYAEARDAYRRCSDLTTSAELKDRAKGQLDAIANLD